MGFCSFKSIFIMKFSFLVDTITTHIFTQTRNLGVILDSFFLISHIPSILSCRLLLPRLHTIAEASACAEQFVHCTRGLEPGWGWWGLFVSQTVGFVVQRGAFFWKCLEGVPFSNPRKGAGEANCSSLNCFSLPSTSFSLTNEPPPNWPPCPLVCFSSCPCYNLSDHSQTQIWHWHSLA